MYAKACGNRGLGAGIQGHPDICLIGIGQKNDHLRGAGQIACV
jgi:hypothetical protein